MFIQSDRRVRPADGIRVAPIPAQATEAGEALQSIGEIAGVVASELDADGILIAWHGAEQPARPLFFRHASGSASAEAMAMAAAEQALLAPVDGPGPYWRMVEVGAIATGALTAKFSAGTSTVTVTTMFDTIGGATRTRARDAILRLWPIMRAFFGMWGQRLSALSRLSHLTAAIDTSDVGLILVDRLGRVLLTNSAAAALLAQNDGLRLAGGTLAASRLSDTLRLQATIEHVIANGSADGSGATSFPVLALPRAARRPLMAAVAAHDDADGDCAVAISLFDPDQDLRPLLEPACKLYRLSPVESRLACLIADGISLSDAAAAMHVREGSARSYLKQIFLKTDTRRQAELVRLMLKSAVRATRACRASLV